jgi:hypothetical protein
LKTWKPTFSTIPALQFFSGISNAKCSNAAPQQKMTAKTQRREEKNSAFFLSVFVVNNILVRRVLSMAVFETKNG